MLEHLSFHFNSWLSFSAIMSSFTGIGLAGRP